MIWIVVAFVVTLIVLAVFITTGGELHLYHDYVPDSGEEEDDDSYDPPSYV